VLTKKELKDLVLMDVPKLITRTPLVNRIENDVGEQLEIWYLKQFNAERKFDSIARELGISTNAVKSHLNKMKVTKIFFCEKES
jgi:hypothetical protein